MGKHVIVGAGQVGAHLAERLTRRGHDVVVVTRSGSGPDGVERIAADAADRERITRIAARADALYNCVNPRYHRWVQDWPPMASSFLGAAEDTGAVLVTLGNLYGYGPVEGPITEDLPLAATGAKGRVRAKMWQDALAAHEAGRIRTTELRPADYYGPGSTDQSYIGETRFVRPLLAGKRVAYFSDPSIPHAWTYLPDVAEALAVAGTDERAWGRTWHVPTAPAVSTLEVAERLCRIAGAPDPRVFQVPRPAFTALGLFVPMLKELRETRYQFDKPYLLDSSAFESAFAMAPTPLDAALKAVVAASGDGGGGE
ncbi:NAD-dependent epimerase/dehydratase family protein [Actinomadura darangshiensis]|uniref:NAD-dependent epimerase/dehydratase family protein n=1 Tax=Actinomadura darangshiensis TaxID=705336 RepID=A0A4R4ZYF9_9ACTN|nr:NAD-dependent epimerase/dehydratase family protein [Actinomadura darangshiensis]TDD64301.1 NAD-dependent epimerase/dehydratase family protein [Actinomadura darangshiensis]